MNVRFPIKPSLIGARIRDDVNGNGDGRRGPGSIKPPIDRAPIDGASALRDAAASAANLIRR